MSDTKLSIVNQALTAAGEDPLTALAPGSVFANAAIENYDAFVDEELENGSWKFALKTKAGTLLTEEADGCLKYQWQIPTEAKNLQAALLCGRELPGGQFEIEGQVVRTAQNSDIKLRYIYRPAEGRWTARFKRIIVQRLEALFLRVSERHQEAAGRDQDTMVKTAIARHTDARQDRNKPLGSGSLAQARMGRHRRRVS